MNAHIHFLILLFERLLAIIERTRCTPASNLAFFCEMRFSEMQLPERQPQGNWVQTERAAHEAWAALIAKAPKAAQIMHILTARVGEHNAVVISQRNLMKLAKCSRPSVQRALDVLSKDRWIEIRQIGQNGTVNAYIINDRIAWSGKRDGIRYSLFTAAVIASDDEQPDRDDLGHQEPLRRLPSLYRDERQLPSGDGLPPPSEPAFPGMEPDLPSKSAGGQEPLETEQAVTPQRNDA